MCEMCGCSIVKARPLETIAVWLSSDGDDTGSKFTVLVEQIELQIR